MDKSADKGTNKKIVAMLSIVFLVIIIFGGVFLYSRKMKSFTPSVNVGSADASSIDASNSGNVLDDNGQSLFDQSSNSSNDTTAQDLQNLSNQNSSQ